VYRRFGGGDFSNNDRSIMFTAATALGELSPPYQASTAFRLTPTSFAIAESVQPVSLSCCNSS